MAEADGPEEIFRIVLKLSDNMPDKADHLDNCGAGSLRSLDANRKEDIDNCILAYESAVHLTPQDHSDTSLRLNMLGESFHLRLELTGDLTDISEVILYQQEALPTHEGHADMASCLYNLGNSFQSRFEHTSDLADISDAISYQQKAVHLIPE